MRTTPTGPKTRERTASDGDVTKYVVGGAMHARQPRMPSSASATQHSHPLSILCKALKNLTRFSVLQVNGCGSARSVRHRALIYKKGSYNSLICAKDKAKKRKEANQAYMDELRQRAIQQAAEDRERSEELTTKKFNGTITADEEREWYARDRYGSDWMAHI